jgi:tRNA threonylcarbamoyladenosine biosynthesis protein TsaB
VRLLLIDTCGDVGGVALSEGETIAASETLPERGSSSALLPAVSRLLKEMGWALADLDGIGVVAGPGSFTGVRVGLAAAKGLCEAANLPLAAVSRLAVLMEATALEEGCAVLDAGRGEYYVRFVRQGEKEQDALCQREDLLVRVEGNRVVIAEPKLAEPLASLSPELHLLSVELALPVMLRVLQEGGSDVATTDANYVRGESDIYAKVPGALAKAGPV